MGDKLRINIDKDRRLLRQIRTVGGASSAAATPSRRWADGVGR